MSLNYLHSIYTIVLLSISSHGWRFLSFHHFLRPTCCSVDPFNNYFTEWLLHARKPPRHGDEVKKNNNVTDAKILDCTGGSATWKLEPGPRGCQGRVEDPKDDWIIIAETRSFIC